VRLGREEQELKAPNKEADELLASCRLSSLAHGPWRDGGDPLFPRSLLPGETEGCTTLYTSGEPCCMCMGAIVWCGIRASSLRLPSTRSARLGQIMIGSTEVADKTPFATINITSGVLAGEAMTLFN
jgi:tRNA(Arg) A34 adenosine deaminase TadA